MDYKIAQITLVLPSFFMLDKALREWLKTQISKLNIY